MQIKYFALIEPNVGNSFDHSGKWKAYPDFHKEIWPHVIMNSESISKIFLFSHSGSSVNQSKFKDYVKENQSLPNGFLEISGLSDLDSDTSDRIKSMCFLDWHFNVFLYSNDTDFLRQFVKLFPHPGQVVADNLGFKVDSDIEALINMVESLKQESFLISISMEAGLVAVLGKEELLNSMQQMI